MDATEHGSIVPDADDLDRLVGRGRPDPRALFIAWYGGLDSRLKWAVGGLGAAVAVALVIWSIVVGGGGGDQVMLPMTRPDSNSSPAPAGSRSTATSTTGPTTLVVHIAGAVVAPGVVQLGPGARVADAVAAAGGARRDADIDRLNLAAPLTDGSRVYVPSLGQLAVPSVVSPQVVAADRGAAGSTVAGASLDLNAATVDQLDDLPGVGPATAAAIVKYRTEHGPFRSVDDLDAVRGIGPAKLDALRDLVTAS